MTISQGTRVGTYNLARLGDEALDRVGDHDALFFEGRWYRSAELAERGRRFARGLTELGVRPGDRVVVLMANCPEVGPTYQAVWRAGAVVTPLVFLVTDEELRYVVTDSGATAVVTTSELLAKVRSALAGLDVRVVCAGLADGDSTDGVVRFEELETAAPLPVVGRDDDELAALLYTGGTTGRSKGVMLSHTNLWTIGRSAREQSYIPGVTRTLLPLPLSHAYGLIVTIVGLHTADPGQSVLMRWFDPAGWVSLAAEHRVQQSQVVPSMLAFLLTLPLEDYDLSELRYVTCGASPLSAAVAEEFERRVPSVTILEGYGCTESAAVISSNPPTARKFGTVGKPIPGVEVRIVDEVGNDVPRGAEGEVIARSSGVMRGYWNDPERTAQTLRDGWLYTGDIGRLDQDGYLTIVDRKKDLIIRGGFNVFPRDVEDALLEHDDIALAAVVGRPDPTYGEEVVAFVVPRFGASLTAEEVIAFARTRIAANKYPREVHVVDQIPHTSVGKVDRKTLRARVRAAG